LGAFTFGRWDLRGEGVLEAPTRGEAGEEIREGERGARPFALFSSWALVPGGPAYVSIQAAASYHLTCQGGNFAGKSRK
jgi:hypothetical protein